MNPIDEYTLFKNSKLNTLTTPIKNGRAINWIKSWDYKGGLTGYTFKTLMPPPYEHANIKYEKHDLNPSFNLIFYKVTITR